MAEPNPTEVGNKFLRRVDSLLRDYKSLVHNVHGQLRQASLETLLAEQTVMSLGIYWEAFIHELIVSYIVQSPGTCIAEFRRRMAQSVSSSFPGGVSWMTLTPPSTLSRLQVEMLLDPRGRNITATEPSYLADTANKLIAAGYAPRFSLNAEDAQFLSFLIALRNYLAHRSNASKLKLKAAALIQLGANAPLQGSTINLPIYMKHRDAVESRVGHIVIRLKQLASKLAL